MLQMMFLVWKERYTLEMYLAMALERLGEDTTFTKQEFDDVESNTVVVNRYIPGLIKLRLVRN